MQADKQTDLGVGRKYTLCVRITWT